MSKVVVMNVSNEKQANRLCNLMLYNIEQEFKKELKIPTDHILKVIGTMLEIKEIVEDIKEEDIEDIATYVSKQAVDIFYTKRINEILQKYKNGIQLNVQELEESRSGSEQEIYKSIINVYNAIKTNDIASISNLL